MKISEKQLVAKAYAFAQEYHADKSLSKRARATKGDADSQNK